MNLYLIEQIEDINAPLEYDVVTAIVGAAKTKREAKNILTPLVVDGGEPIYIGKAKPGTKNGTVILKQTLDG